MQRTSRWAVIGLALTATIAVPTIAIGNARRTEGTLSAIHSTETPYVARLLGANEVPTAGDPDGVGGASVSFAFIDSTNAQVCWDLSWANIGSPTVAHIHTGASGVAGGPVISLMNPSDQVVAAACRSDVSRALAEQIMNAPAGFYVNIHDATYGGGAIRGQLAKGPESAGSTHMLPVPLRAYDSREDGDKSKIGASQTRTISLATGKDGAGAVQIAVPPGAKAALVTLTITETNPPGGFLKIYSAAVAEPATSNINWAQGGLNAAVGTTVAVDAAGAVKVTNGPFATHFLIDVVGYLY